MTGIYKITSPTKRVYIGQSLNIAKRRKEYAGMTNCSKQPKLYNSLQKYGFGKHTFEVIVECEPADLKKWERYYQDLYSALGKHGLNLMLTGYDDKPRVISDDTRAKISEHNKGDKNYFFGKQYFGEDNHFFGKKHSPEVIERFKGKNNPMYGKTGELNPAFGMKHPKEFLRRKQLLHSFPVEVLKDGKCIKRFECTMDAANHFECTPENILFRIKNGTAQFGKFKDLKIIKCQK